MLGSFHNVENVDLRCPPIDIGGSSACNQSVILRVYIAGVMLAELPNSDNEDHLGSPLAESNVYINPLSLLLEGENRNN